MSAFDKIIGYTSIKKELSQLCDMMRDRERYNRLGARMPRGLLINGKPGLGKSLMARCLIEESGRTAYTVRRDQPNSDFINNLRQVFHDAVENAPSIILLEDMDKFVVEEDSKEEYIAIQAGIDETLGADVFIVATVNELYEIPDSLLRAGRFDRKIEISAPTGKEAEDIIRHYLAAKPLGDSVNISDIGKMLYGHSCAELEMAMNEAAVYAGAEHSSKIEMPHMVDAILRNVYELQDDGLPLCDKELEEFAYHEAGHAVVQDILCEGSVGFATILSCCNGPRGVAFTCRDRMQSRMQSSFCSILVSLSGLAAEELRFGIKGIGGRKDIRNAIEEIEWHWANTGLLGLGLAQGRLQCGSETLQAKREEAISRELDRFFVQARRILAQNREFLDAVAVELRKKRTLLNSDIRRIRAECVNAEIPALF